jgi:hypothetical protein
LFKGFHHRFGVAVKLSARGCEGGHAAYLLQCAARGEQTGLGPECAFLLANIFPKMASPHMMPTQYRFTANGHDDMRILRV